MDGSLAVWCDTAAKQVVGLEPRLDLHLNLWIELGKGIPNALDVGILLKELRQIESLNIYFPVEVPPVDIHDLSGVLQNDLRYPPYSMQRYMLVTHTITALTLKTRTKKLNLELFNLMVVMISKFRASETVRSSGSQKACLTTLISTRGNITLDLD